MLLGTAYASEPNLAIERCSIFDPITKTMIDDQTVVIAGERIIRVAGFDEVGELPGETVLIDGRGKFVIAGLIDAHVHLVHVLDFADD